MTALIERTAFAMHGVNLREGLLLKAMIERAAQRLGLSFVYSALESANLVFYSGAPPPVRDARLVKLIADDGEPAGLHCLRMPPRASEVLSVLINRGQADTGVGGSEVGELVRRVFELVGQLKPAHALIDSNGQGLAIFPSTRQFAWLGGSASQRIGELLSEKRLLSLRLTELPDSARLEMDERRGIEPLLWHLGIAYADIELLPWVPTEAILRLRVWPYLVAQAPRSFIKMATALRNRAQSFAALIADTEVSPEEATAFVNAATLCGFLVVERPSSRDGVRIATPLHTHHARGFGRLMGAIRGALGIRR